MGEKDPLSRALEIVGTVVAVAILYLTAAPYFGWWPTPPQQQPTPADHSAVVTATSPNVSWPLAIVGIILICATISHIFLRVRSQRSFKFFPNRHELQKFSGGSLGARLEKSESVSAIMVNAQDFYGRKININRITKLLLPNPDKASIKHYIDHSAHDEQAAAIREATRRAKAAGARVRWYDHFLFQSIVLSDPDKKSGWVQVESMLPHSHPSYRPSYTIHKKTSERAVLEMQRIFNEIWDTASEQ